MTSFAESMAYMGTLWGPSCTGSSSWTWRRMWPTNNSPVGIHSIIDISKFSSLTKLIAVTAYVRRFINNCRRQDTASITGPLTTSELLQANLQLVCHVQCLTFHDETTTLKQQNRHLSLIHQLRFFRWFVSLWWTHASFLSWQDSHISSLLITISQNLSSGMHTEQSFTVGLVQPSQWYDKHTGSRQSVSV